MLRLLQEKGPCMMTGLRYIIHA